MAFRNWLLGAALAALAAGPAPASAHSVLLSSTPKAEATVPAGPMDFSVSFDSRIDAKRSRLTLEGPDGSATVLPATQAAPGSVTGHADALKPGKNQLRWEVLSVDGHIARGIVPFTVAP